ncbi:metal ABC transporter substrate-binding protein [Tistrella mobilis]|uniref:Metal ABC transporter substrate-binding protein n=2 Tax=Tistrella mobilis TaxID=171437 RepID=A0A162KPJ0_9PROT|nr:metal ABC transporter substrate-binding protein [Tistrella mobilis]KYO51802.1 metal ABC transporter substrate-binding protein [Tistrella mobilis]
MINRRHLLAAGTLVALALRLPVPALAADEPIRVVASFSILGDMVQQVGGDRVRVTTLVGPDGDAHVWQPAPADARTVADADLVVMNGLGFEGWMDRLVQASGYDGPVAVATTGIVPRQMAEAEEGEEDHDHAGGEDHDHDHHHGGTDPHAWQSLTNARIYVHNVLEALIAADSDDRPVFEANAAAYLKKIDALDARIRAEIASVPADRRKVVTSHDAFGYFAAAYGVGFLAPVGVSTEAEASAGDVAKLIDQIRAEKIPAVFMENISDPRLLDRIASETDAKIGGTLYSDALSPAGGPAATYLDMMDYNVRTLVAALRT